MKKYFLQIRLCNSQIPDRKPLQSPDQLFHFAPVKEAHAVIQNLCLLHENPWKFSDASDSHLSCRGTADLVYTIHCNNRALPNDRRPVAVPFHLAEHMRGKEYRCS